MSFALPGSRTEEVSDIELHSNVHKDGRFVYRVDRIVDDEECNNELGNCMGF